MANDLDTFDLSIPSELPELFNKLYWQIHTRATTTITATGGTLKQRPQGAMDIGRSLDNYDLRRTQYGISASGQAASEKAYRDGCHQYVAGSITQQVRDEIKNTFLRAQADTSNKLEAASDCFTEVFGQITTYEGPLKEPIKTFIAERLLSVQDGIDDVTSKISRCRSTLPAFDDAVNRQRADRVEDAAVELKDASMPPTEREQRERSRFATLQRLEGSTPIPSPWPATAITYSAQPPALTIGATRSVDPQRASPPRHDGNPSRPSTPQQEQHVNVRKGTPRR